MFSYGLMDNARGPAFSSVLRQFGVSNTEGSLMFAVSSLAGLLIVLVANWWLKRFGELTANRVFLVSTTVGFMACGLSGYIENGGFIVLIASSFFFGLGHGGSATALNVMIAHGTNETARRRIFSGMHSMYGVSSVVAPLLFSLFLINGSDWRVLFITISLIPLVVFFAGSNVKAAHDGSKNDDVHSGVAFKLRAAIGLIVSLYVSAEIIISSRLPYFISTTTSMAPENASLYLSLFFIMLMSGRIIFSLVKIPYRSENLMITSVVISLAFNLLGLFYHPVFLSVCGLTMSIFFPCTMDMITRRFGDRAGLMIASAIKWFTAMLVVMHWGIGFLTDTFGIRNAMLTGPVLLVAVLILVVSYKRNKDAHTPHTAAH